MDLIHLAQRLKAITKDVSEVQLEDLEESYMSLTDIKEVADVLLRLVEEKYYDGWNERAEFYLEKLNEVTELMKEYIAAYAL